MGRTTLLALGFILLISSCSTQRSGRNYTLNQSRMKTQKKQNHRPAEKQDSWLLHEGEEIDNRTADVPSRKSELKKNKLPADKRNRAESTTRNNASTTAREDLVLKAKQFIGTPYRYGGNGPGAFDCSGFTKYCMREIGVELARNSTYQSRQGKKKKIQNAQTGDLVFFGKGKKIEHVGIVVENTGSSLQVIHASTSRGVIVQDVLSSSYWKPRILYAVDMVSTADYEIAGSRK